MVEKKEWKEFQNTGLVLIINQILHIFGWAIVFEQDDDGNINKAYPARVKFRGFSNDSTDNAYAKLTSYMKENSDILYDETVKKVIEKK